MPKWQDTLCKGGAYLFTARITVKYPTRDFPKIRRKKNLLLLRPITAAVSSICRNPARRRKAEKKRKPAPKPHASRADAMRRRAMIQVHAADRLCLMRCPASHAIPASHADHASRRNRHSAARRMKAHARLPEYSQKYPQRIYFFSVRHYFFSFQRKAIISSFPFCLYSS